MASLENLYITLADALDGELPIEALGRRALLETAPEAFCNEHIPLPKEIEDVMSASDAHPCCKALASAPLPWVVPVTSNDPDYIAASTRKVLVELVGPDGIVRRNDVRVGVYGIRPGANYGIRTHPAEELFVMVAGKAQWLKGEENYAVRRNGARIHHVSGIPHATRTTDSAFMSIYVWSGDVSFDNFVYSGVPEEKQ